MNFNIIEGAYTDLDSIREDFTNDYIWSNELSNVEIQKKYELTCSEFKELADSVKNEYGFSRRPNKGKSPRHYYYHQGKYIISKTMCNICVYFGIVPTEYVAKKVVELCKKWQWDIDVCREICKNWKAYIV